MAEIIHQPCPYEFCGSTDAFPEITYNSFTGKIYKKWKEVGTLHQSTGYLYVRFQGKTHLAHRVIFYLVSGVWPNQIDHINGDRTDNRWLNLREVDTTQQATNKRGWSNTGCKGVYWNKRRERYHARVRFNGKVHHVGYFKDLSEAKSAYDKLAKELHGDYYNGGHISPTLSI